MRKLWLIQSARLVQLAHCYLFQTEAWKEGVALLRRMTQFLNSCFWSWLTITDSASVLHSRNLVLCVSLVVKMKQTLSSTTILKANRDVTPFNKSFKYDKVIGQLLYLDKGSRMDIAYAAHQCARFSKEPKIKHVKAIRWLGGYLYATKYKVTNFKPDPTRGL